MDIFHLFKLGLIKSRYEHLTQKLNEAILSKDLDKIQDLQERLTDVNKVFNEEFEKLVANRKNC